MLHVGATTGAEGAQKREGIDSGFVMIREGEVKRVVADQVCSQSLEICRHAIGIQHADSTDFVTASGASAVLPKVAKRIGAEVSVLPGDPELLLSDFLELNRSRVHLTLLRFGADAR